VLLKGVSHETVLRTDEPPIAVGAVADATVFVFKIPDAQLSVQFYGKVSVKGPTVDVFVTRHLRKAFTKSRELTPYGLGKVRVVAEVGHGTS
jgi:hypothetical protein